MLNRTCISSLYWHWCYVHYTPSHCKIVQAGLWLGIGIPSWDIYVSHICFVREMAYAVHHTLLAWAMFYIGLSWLYCSCYHRWKLMNLHCWSLFGSVEFLLLYKIQNSDSDYIWQHFKNLCSVSLWLASWSQPFIELLIHDIINTFYTCNACDYIHKTFTKTSPFSSPKAWSTMVSWMNRGH